MPSVHVPRYWPACVQELVDGDRERADAPAVAGQTALAMADLTACQLLVIGLDRLSKISENYLPKTRLTEVHATSDCV
jgi:hypothetical protein